ncbi:hypothetical protein E4U53_007698 [Claviceps sorghi]|nr:hypothetical protein E4U53_007698 [Claviceps sorghi]
MVSKQQLSYCGHDRSRHPSSGSVSRLLLLFSLSSKDGWHARAAKLKLPGLSKAAAVTAQATCKHSAL